MPFDAPAPRRAAHPAMRLRAAVPPAAAPAAARLRPALTTRAAPGAACPPPAIPATARASVRLGFAILALAALAVIAALAGPVRAQGHAGHDHAGHDHATDGSHLGTEDLRQLARDIHDENRAHAAVARLRAYVGGKPDSNYIPLVRAWIVRGLIEDNASAREIAGAADSAEAVLIATPPSLFRFYTDVAQALVMKNADLPRARGYLYRAMAQLPPGDPRMDNPRAVLRGTLGQAQLLAGDADSAATTFQRALENHPDSVQVLLGLGQAYEKLGRKDEAIGVYVRSMAAYPRHDTTGAAPLRALWRSRHGSLAGLDQRVREARERGKLASFAERRYEKPMPAWSLRSLAGEPVKSSDFAGKPMVLDFWGSWCGPCREELPIFQRLYEKYKDRVAFIGLNWERPGLPEERVKRARDYMTQNKFTFPVVLDHERVAVEAFQLEGFPTAFLVDRTGQIRFKNVGVAPGIEQILTDQIESLLN